MSWKHFIAVKITEAVGLFKISRPLSPKALQHEFLKKSTLQETVKAIKYKKCVEKPLCAFREAAQTHSRGAPCALLCNFVSLQLHAVSANVSDALCQRQKQKQKINRIYPLRVTVMS